jgi:hypothetical protein
MASIGAILAARRAGSQADSVVTATPTANDTARAELEMAIGPSGSSIPNCDISFASPVATPTPAASPAAEATAPTMVASINTDPLTWRPEAPMALSSAISRVRWATVMEKVLLMMNAPTNMATSAKINRMVVKAAKLAASDAWFSAINAAPVITSTSLSTQRQRLDDRALRDAVVGGDGDRVGLSR